MITKNIKRLSFAFAGIFYALKNDSSYRQQFYGIGIVIAIFIYLYQDITQTELFFLVLAYALILITELQNSSLEEALDHMHPELHDKIGRSKDMAAGAVLTAGFILLFVIIAITFF